MTGLSLEKSFSDSHAFRDCALKISSGRRIARWAAVLLSVFPALPVHARIRHNESWARDHFAAAERMREALNGRPIAERTRRDYQKVLNAYRNVYFGAPASAKADPSVVAVAETLVEMGRRFEDDKILKEAISQYRFLRREYPGSKYRFDALFTIGEIYKDDLNNSDQARSTFQDFLRRYPHNRLSADAQQAIADLDRGAVATKNAGTKTARNIKGEKKETIHRAFDGNKPAEQTLSADKSKTHQQTLQENTDGSDQETSQESTADALPAAAASSTAHSEEAAVDATSARLPRVTRIRHWSTPNYTRVAIDLEGEIKFGAKRIAHPDRIFFDLRDTKLASTLVGKSFDVDDGFLKKIRIAQFQPGRTRVVLEVADLSEYDAFLIPNPYRLIIDIHGKESHGVRGDDSARQIPIVDSTDNEASSRSAVPAAKAPITNMDVADRTQIIPKDTAPRTESEGKPSTIASNGSGFRKAPTIIKKIVEADDEDENSIASSGARVSGVTSDDDLASPNMKISANSHTVVSRPPRKSTRDTSNHKPESTEEAGVREAQPTARGDRSLIRALGLKIGKIVIDPGHGGHDTGTIGPNGLEEKDLVLEVGRRLGRLLEARLGAEVVYTRRDDTFIPLETRTAIANQERADLFISIHANSSHDSAARGVETYYLNFTSSPEALEVAARENAVSEKSIYELQDLVKKIALKEKIEESREFAGDVQQSLHSGLAVKSPDIRDRGVKKAPFIVLIGANMPSILAEISFVSNPSDERHLETSEYRQRIAESLYRGVARYVNGLSGIKVASKLDKASGQ
ncbi:MAG TPA: N-acetylmuramoyl-L-alanine amidase [Candidatus Sulfotelmatobacter sp.]